MDGCGPCKVFLSSLEAAIEQCRRSPAECPAGKRAVKLRKDVMKNYAKVVTAFRPQNVVSSRPASRYSFEFPCNKIRIPALFVGSWKERRRQS